MLGRYMACGTWRAPVSAQPGDGCHAEHLVAFSCKCRGFCTSCGARRMAESSALLVDEVLPEQPMRQWVHQHGIAVNLCTRSIDGGGGSPADQRLVIQGRIPNGNATLKIVEACSYITLLHEHHPLRWRHALAVAGPRHVDTAGRLAARHHRSRDRALLHRDDRGVGRHHRPQRCGAE